MLSIYIKSSSWALFLPIGMMPHGIFVPFMMPFYVLMQPLYSELIELEVAWTKCYHLSIWQCQLNQPRGQSFLTLFSETGSGNYNEADFISVDSECLKGNIWIAPWCGVYRYCCSVDSSVFGWLGNPNFGHCKLHFPYCQVLHFGTDWVVLD